MAMGAGPYGACMKKLITTLGMAMVMAMPLTATQAQAGPSTDALSACLARSTTADDHIVLVDWIFAMIARHPSVSGMTSISSAQRAEINRKAGALFTRLLTDSCGAEVKQAYKEDGMIAVQSAFSSLGAAAMQDLMSNPDVQAAGNDIQPYVDQQKLGAVLK